MTFGDAKIGNGIGSWSVKACMDTFFVNLLLVCMNTFFVNLLLVGVVYVLLSPSKNFFFFVWKLRQERSKEVWDRVGPLLRTELARQWLHESTTPLVD